MDLSKALSPELILVAPKAADKWQLFEVMIDAIRKGPFAEETLAGVSCDLLDAVVAREKQRPTGMGEGIALPHARIPGLPGFLLCMAIVPEKIVFGPGEEACNIVVMVLTPEEEPIVALKVMGAVAQSMQNEETKAALLAAKNSKEAYLLLQGSDLFLGDTVTARTIMRAPRITVPPEMGLRAVTRAMLTSHVEAAPVVNSEGTVIGEVLCDQLFKAGVPDFFGQLASVSFIRKFDPFEKYFEAESHATAEEVMNRDHCVMGEDATLLEIVFALSIKKHTKVYVVHEGHLVGIIDRIAVLDRIFNL